MNSWLTFRADHPWHRLGWRDYRFFLVVVWRFYRKWGICRLPSAVRMAWASFWYLPTAEEEAEWKIGKEPKGA